jgi:CheY-like chemotaxis protein
VDDDPDDLYLIEHAFTRIMPSIVIKQLYDGEELLPNLEKAAKLPRLVLLDLNMQRMNGFETLAELRRNPAYKDLPVIILTTSDAEADRQRSLALGADGFLTKPPSQEGIVHMLKQLTADWQLQ